MQYSAGSILILILLAATSIALADVNITSEGLIVSDAGVAGGSITIIEVIQNSGGDESGPVTISYYLVNNTDSNTSKVQIGTTDLDPIASGGNYSSVQTFLLPFDIAEGAYRFVREVIGTESIDEEQQPDNRMILISDTMPKGGVPDLIGSGVIAPTKAGPGDQIRVIAAVANIGGADTQRFSVDFYLTNRSVFGEQPLLLGTWEIELIPATGQASTTRTFTIPVQTTAGEYGILMDIDSDNRVSEADEGNNDWYRDGMIKIIGERSVILPNLPMLNSTSTIVIGSPEVNETNITHNQTD